MKFFRPLLMCLVQVVIFVTLYFVAVLIAKALGMKFSESLAWTLNVKYAIVIFTGLSIVLNFLWTLDLTKLQKGFLLLLLLVGFTTFFIKALNYYPYKVSLLIICALLSFSTIYFFEWLLHKRWRTKD